MVGVRAVAGNFLEVMTRAKDVTGGAVNDDDAGGFIAAGGANGLVQRRDHRGREGGERGHFPG